MSAVELCSECQTALCWSVKLDQFMEATTGHNQFDGNETAANASHGAILARSWRVVAVKLFLMIRQCELIRPGKSIQINFPNTNMSTSAILDFSVWVRKNCRTFCETWSKAFNVKILNKWILRSWLLPSLLGHWATSCLHRGWSLVTLLAPLQVSSIASRSSKNVVFHMSGSARINCGTSCKQRSKWAQEADFKFC